ncbi:MAG: hypothetical protein ACK5T0_05705 [Vampirovibrionales bacterium]|jgi:hypothetical protein
MAVVASQKTNINLTQILAFPLQERTARVKGLFLVANNSSAKFNVLEDALLAMGHAHVAGFLIDVLQSESSSQADVQLASMTLIRMGNAVREDILRFAMNATGERAVWIADFMVHQLGLKKAS